MSDSPDPSDNTFSRRLDHLFKTITSPDGNEYSCIEVQNGTQQAVTAAYIWRLRTGRAKNPGYGVIKALSHFFGVSPSYFFEGDEQAAEQADDAARNRLPNLYRGTIVEEIALLASQLDEKGRRAVLGFLTYLVRY